MGKRTSNGGKFEVVKQGTPKSGQPVLNRRQKQKVSDMIKSLRINYNKLMMKKKESSNPEKHAIVEESIKLIGEKYTELCYKHDGCRVLQALVKFGNKPQRTLVVDKIKPLFTTLMSSKYSHYLASKAFYYAPEPAQKAFIRSQVQNQI